MRKTAELIVSKLKQQEHTIKFLEYLRVELMYAIGPADMDIYDKAREYWLNNYGSLPKGYEFEGDED